MAPDTSGTDDETLGPPPGRDAQQVAHAVRRVLALPGCEDAPLPGA